MHDVAIGSRADRSGKYAREVERAPPRDFGQRVDLDRLIKMGNDIVLEPAEHVRAQLAACLAFEFGSMTSEQAIDESARNRVPAKRPVGVAFGAFERHAAREIEQRLIETRQALEQLCLERRALR